MAANLVARRWPRAEVSVVESPDIPIIGVGEGSTPQLKVFFDTIGVSESEWMPACNATYKNGIRFRGWSHRPGFEEYFHPFPSQLDVHTAPAFSANALARRRGRNACAHPDRFFVPARLAALRLAPRAPANFPFAIGYGYHFDAHLVGAFLKRHAKAKGVQHLERRICSVAVDEGGNVRHLVAEGGETIGGDVFIDSSGFRSVIAQEALHVPFRSFERNLFNDAAVVMPSPADPAGTDSQTVSHALKHGWAWEIPLTNRTGNGYVYSSRYCSAEDAEAELREHLGLSASEVPARHLRMKVGRIERSWAGNCLAIGLAQGFIEPLEATALHIVQSSIEGFLKVFEEGDFTPRHRNAYNEAIAARYEGIRDYIVCHYRVNRRSDTQYWRDNAANNELSDSLKQVMTAWFTGKDMEAEIARQGIARYYNATSWQCLLAGYGTFPQDAPAGGGALAPDRSLDDMAAIDAFVAGCASNFPDHKRYLESSLANPEPSPLIAS